MRVILELMRYRNCAMAGFASVIGAAIAYSSLAGELFWMLPVFVSVFLITGAGNAINDYYDANIDAINRPSRPIPSGRIKTGFAFCFSVFLFAAGITIAYFIGPTPFFIAIFNSLLLYFYAFSLKRKVFVGNISVAYLSGSTFLFGSAAFGNEGIRITFVLFLLSVLATLGREIVKAIEDIEGDRKEGAKTLPLLIGDRASAYLACAFGLVAVLLSPIPYISGLFNGYYLFVVGIADFFFFYSILLILKRKPRASSRYFKVAMFFGLLAFVAGSALRN